MTQSATVRVLQARLEKNCDLIDRRSRNFIKDLVKRQLIETEVEILDNILGWLEQFEEHVVDNELVLVAHDLCQMGVQRPGGCACGSGELRGFAAWNHANHQLLNRALWEILNGHFAILKMREVLEEDLRVPDQMMAGIVCGAIFAKDQARLLLEHFLIPEPNPEWVGNR